jgi:hypothetical protein
MRQRWNRGAGRGCIPRTTPSDVEPTDARRGEDYPKSHDVLTAIARSNGDMRLIAVAWQYHAVGVAISGLPSSKALVVAIISVLCD